MAKYIANPIEVEAYKIILVTQENPFSQTSDYWGYVTVEDVENIRISKEMTSRMEPKIGDYFVIGHDGYRYLNPKDVFEAKYYAADEKCNNATEPDRHERILSMVIENMKNGGKLEHHKCSICECAVGFIMCGEQLYFDTNCDCSIYPSTPYKEEEENLKQFLSQKGQELKFFYE